MIQKRYALLFSFVALLQVACSTAYYNTMETFGIHKRDILVDRVDDARDSQQEAKEQFQSTLEQFSSVVNFDGGELEKTYKSLRDELESSEKKAEAVSDHIDSVEKVAKDLFKEWRGELKQYSSASLRTQSERQLNQTEQRYEKLMAAMRRAEALIEPVLEPFRDQVLFLKHNLNAQAIAALQGELVKVENDTTRLIAELETSIAAADRFISQTKLDIQN